MFDRPPPDTRDAPDDSADDSVPRARPARRWLRRLLVGGGVLALAGATYLGVLIVTTPDVDALRAASTARPSVILSADGEVIGRFATAYQAPVALDGVAPVVVQALIATEDHRFYTHHGLDPWRILGSAWRTLQGDLQGASTLTQQLARNLFPQDIGSGRNLNRKLREAITAVRMERHSSKQAILESYLNSAPFLYNVRGFEMAARTYFNVSAAELDTVQAATLVGMLKGSHRYNPVRHPERALERRNVVLGQMWKRGVLSRADYEALRARPLALSFSRPEDGEIGQTRHFVAAIRERIVEWADQHDFDLDRDGLVIHTTLDSRLQRLAQQAVSQQVAQLQRVAGREWSEARMPSVRLNQPEARQPFAHFWQRHPALVDEMVRESPEYAAALQAGLSAEAAHALVSGDAELMARLREDKTRLSAGFVAIEPGTGAVRAWVGSPDYGHDQYDHVLQARRQPGSTFKPFVYGAAIAKGLSTERPYLDAEVDIPLETGQVWRPTDMGGSSGRPMTMREGLVLSKNTVTAQVMMDVGPRAVSRFARLAGVRASPLDPVPSLALGTSPVTLLEMSNAYATLASLGRYRPPVLLTHLSDRNGRVLARFDEGPAPEQVIDRGVAEQLVDVMRGVVDRGTGTSLRSEFRVRGDLAGKTGTSQNNTDGWFIVMNPDLVAGAWVGFNDQRVTIRSDYWGQGAHNALRIVGDFLRQAQREQRLPLDGMFPVVVRVPEPAASEPEVALPPAAGGSAPDTAAGLPNGDEPTDVPVVPELPMSSRDRPFR